MSCFSITPAFAIECLPIHSFTAEKERQDVIIPKPITFLEEKYDSEHVHEDIMDASQIKIKVNNKVYNNLKDF